MTASRLTQAEIFRETWCDVSLFSKTWRPYNSSRWWGDASTRNGTSYYGGDLLNLERGGGPFSSDLAAVLDIPIRFSFVLVGSREESVKLGG